MEFTNLQVMKNGLNSVDGKWGLVFKSNTDSYANKSYTNKSSICTDKSHTNRLTIRNFYKLLFSVFIGNSFFKYSSTKHIIFWTRYLCVTNSKK